MTKIIKRIRGFRSNENGQVMLLSGVMIFFIAMFVVVTVDSSVTIKHKIIAQNAVDSAADAGALWQARGLNLIQHLNNFHRIVNYVATGVESVGCVACIASAPLLIAKNIPLVQAVAEPAWQLVCVACVLCAGTDKIQSIVAQGINAIQLAASYTFPIVAFISANSNAKNSEADTVLSAVTSYLAEVVDGVTGDLVNVPDFSNALFDGIPVYAFPINVDQMLLSVEEKEGTKYPWKTPVALNITWQVAGNIALVGCVSHFAYNQIQQNTNDLNSGSEDEKKWGYYSKFYWGNPGFITWIAGKAAGPEAGKFYGVGLQDAVWLDSTAATVEADDIEVWYTGQTFNNSNGHKVPPVIALASAHVEGSVVVSDNVDPDATGHLIPVQSPFGDDDTGNELNNLLIYH